jgi:hypothetical protein
MPQLARKQAVGIKTEATQGTAIAITATDFALAYDVSITPMVELNAQKYVSTTLSRFRDIPGRKYYEVEFTLPLKGSGTAGTANAPLGAALQACGMTETASVGVSVTYAFTSAAASASFYGPGKSATVKIYQDGMLHVAAGCMFEPSFDIVAGKPVGIKFKGKGIYAAVTDASFPTVTALTNDPPIVQSASATIQAYAAKFEKLSIQFGNQVSEIADVNSTAGILGFQITDREVTGSVDPNRELVATHDFWGKMMSGAEAAYTIAIGATAGNIATISGSKMQYGQVKTGNRNGIATLDVPLMFNRSSGDDELQIVLT